MVFHHLLGGDVSKKKTCKPNSKWFLHPVCAGSTQKRLVISISLGCVKCACIFVAVFDFVFAGKFSKVRELGLTFANWTSIW